MTTAIITEAARKYLKVKGYEVLEQEWEGGIIAMQDETVLVFAEVLGGSSDEKRFPDEELGLEKRTMFEKAAMDFFEENALSDVVVRFDTVSVITYGTDRAFIRHHINASQA